MSRSTASHSLPAPPLDPTIQAKRDEKIQVAMVALCGCWGCTLSFLDMDEKLPALLDRITLTRSSLTDIKRIPHRCRIGFIEGGVGNAENIETLKQFRQQCDTLIAVGACAIWGGVPAMRNVVSLEACLREAYIDSPTAPSGTPQVIPHHPDIPTLTNRVYPCHEVVKIDHFIPGCPPDADAIFNVLNDLVNGHPINLPTSLIRYD